MRRHTAAWAAAAALALAACAGPPPPPPMLSVTTASCPAAPDLGGAVALTFGTKDAKPVGESFDKATPCFEPAPGAKSLYRVFALPQDTPPYIVSVASAPFGQGIFAPHVTTLDSGGEPLREIPRSSFVFRGSDLTVLFRSHPEERYLLVASDPASLGMKIERVEERTQAAGAMAGGAYFQIHTGTDTTSDLVYAANGQVTVTLSALPSAEPKD